MIVIILLLDCHRVTQSRTMCNNESLAAYDSSAIKVRRSLIRVMNNYTEDVGAESAPASQQIYSD